MRGCLPSQFVEKFRKQNKILMEAIDDIVDDVKAVSTMARIDFD